MGDAGTQRVEFIRALEEFDHLFELFFLLVFARHIGKGSGLFVFPLVLDLGFAHVHDTAAGTAAAAIAVESEETINPSMSAETVLARAAK